MCSSISEPNGGMTDIRPQVNDYVKWHSHTGLIEGWVYFSDSEYITIEISTREMSEREQEDTPHKKHHCLVVCFPWHWKDLTIIGSRDSKYSNTIKPS